MKIDEIVQVFAEIQDKQEMQQFFDEIFTPAEKKAVSLRWELMKMLHEKIPQRKISEELRISLCKITRGAKIMKSPSSVARKYVAKHAEKKSNT